MTTLPPITIVKEQRPELFLYDIITNETAYNIYPMKAPDNARNPMIIYNNIFEEKFYGVNALTDVLTAAVQLDIYTDNYKELQDIKRHIISVLWKNGVQIKDVADSYDDKEFRTMISTVIWN